MPLKLLIALATCVLLAQASPQDDTESFITKEAAKELRNKLSSSVEQQDDYDEILKDIIRGLREKPKSDQQQIFYEKKYFDYLPNEIVDSDDETSEDLTRESVNPDSSSGDESSESVRRAKREAPIRNKRHYQIYHQPLQHFSPLPQITFYFPYDLFSDYSEPIPVPRSYYPVAPPQYNRGYNPGNPQQNPNSRYYPPGNFYLPPVPTTRPPNMGYLPPASNLPHPPDNRPGSETEFDNRVAGFEGSEGGPIFGIRPVRPINGNSISGFGKGSSSSASSSSSNFNNRYPAPQTTTQSTFNFDMDSFGKESQENVELEFAPELVDDVSTTTRASIKRPTRKNQNKSQQQNSRQRKSVPGFL